MKKIALIGNGYWGSKILKYLPEFFDVKYVVGRDVDLEKILEDIEIEAVVIATPINTHYELAGRSIEYKKYVYVEKPVALTEKEVLILDELAYKKKVKIACEYTQTFSKSVMKMISIFGWLGKPNFIEMSTKHLGKFLPYDVFWLLASHHLSILDMFTDIDNMNYSFDEQIFTNCICTTGSIKFEGEHFNGILNVNLNCPIKENYIRAYGNNYTLILDFVNKPSLTLTGYDGSKLNDTDLTTIVGTHDEDEGNNLRYSMQYFRDFIEGKAKSNMDTAIKITRILERR